MVETPVVALATIPFEKGGQFGSRVGPYVGRFRDRTMCGGLFLSNYS